MCPWAAGFGASTETREPLSTTALPLATRTVSSKTTGRPRPMVEHRPVCRDSPEQRRVGRSDRGEGERCERDQWREAPRAPRMLREASASLAALVPIYEYKCPNGHLFDAFHGMTEPGPTVCTVCGEGPLQIVLHPVAVHYKGSGFYSTDYGRKSKQPAKDGGSGESSRGSSSGGESGGGSGGPAAPAAARAAAARARKPPRRSAPASPRAAARRLFRSLHVHVTHL